MTVEYYIEKTDCEYWLQIGTHTVAEIYFDAENCASPLTEKNAKSIVEMLKNILELVAPVSDEDAEKYGTTEEAKELEKLFDKAEEKGMEGVLGLMMALQSLKEKE